MAWAENSIYIRCYARGAKKGNTPERRFVWGKGFRIVALPRNIIPCSLLTAKCEVPDTAGATIADVPFD